MATAIRLFANLGVILLLFLVGPESSVGEVRVGPRALLATPRRSNKPSSAPRLES